MSEYKRWKHAAWALVFMAACARDTHDSLDEELERAHDGDAEPEDDTPTRVDVHKRAL